MKKHIFILIASLIVIGCGGGGSTNTNTDSSVGGTGQVPDFSGFQWVEIWNGVNKNSTIMKDKISTYKNYKDAEVAITNKKYSCKDFGYSEDDYLDSGTENGMQVETYRNNSYHTCTESSFLDYAPDYGNLQGSDTVIVGRNFF